VLFVDEILRVFVVNQRKRMMSTFVSRAGLKLEHALATFGVDVAGKTCADLGCNAGGFTDCLLKRGAAKVYAVDTGYGALDWKLRNDPRVVPMERTNAMHVTLPEPMQIVVIDVAWTRQRHVLPNAKKLLAPGGVVVTLIKPHYEANKPELKQGVLRPEAWDGVLQRVHDDISAAGFKLLNETPSPIKGQKGNAELLAMLQGVE
jgi:23S rRNA (cytidine1920-2'-O)/16S rRNA (cytidine1409-2'-O)-methyltransferase